MSVKVALFPCCFLVVVLASLRPSSADDEAKPESPPPASAGLKAMGMVSLEKDSVGKLKVEMVVAAWLQRDR